MEVRCDEVGFLLDVMGSHGLEFKHLVCDRQVLSLNQSFGVCFDFQLSDIDRVRDEVLEGLELVSGVEHLALDLGGLVLHFELLSF